MYDTLIFAQERYEKYSQNEKKKNVIQVNNFWTKLREDSIFSIDSFLIRT